MFLPDDIITVIRDYSKPIGIRLAWRMGSYHGQAIQLRIRRIQYEMKAFDIDTFFRVVGMRSRVEKRWAHAIYLRFLKSRGTRTNI